MRLGLHSLSKLVVRSNSGDMIPVSNLRLTPWLKLRARCPTPPELPTLYLGNVIAGASIELDRFKHSLAGKLLGS